MIHLADRKMDSKQITNHDSLAHLPIGSEAKVSAVNGDNAITRRLMEMGVVPGVSVRVVKTAPFGCPMEIRVRGYNLALRRAEAESISVKDQKV
jgi:ferrous iron transport protein A